MAKRKKHWKRREPRSENRPIPQYLISSRKPDPTVGWCGNCQAHTKQEKKTRVVTSTDHQNRIRESVCCRYCKSTMLWNIPSHVQRSVNVTFGGIAVIGLIMTIDLVGFAFWDNSGDHMTCLVLGTSLPIVVAMLIWLLFLRWQWCSWLGQHPQRVDERWRGRTNRRH